MKNKNIIIFLISFLIFFFSIFFLIQIFFPSNDAEDYNKTIEPSEQAGTGDLKSADTLGDDFLNIDKKAVNNEEVSKRYNQILSEYKNNILKKEAEDLNNKIIKYNFYPTNIEETLESQLKTSSITSFLYSKVISSKNPDLSLTFYKSTDGIRGKYKDKNINIYGALDLPRDEEVAVFIHEFGHYFDIDYFKNDVFNGDLSEKFYNISWQSTKVLNGGQKISDFVSGYAMTNKYEDFAESFIYYILHNGDFLKKASKSEYLKEKYDFFGNYLFVSQEFKNTNFSKTDKVLDYYRDITKIDYFLQNLLNYLEK